MNIKDYQKLAGRTLAVLLTKEQNLHLVLGMITEVGELADVYKKQLAYGKEVDTYNVREELGDLLFYIVNFCSVNEIDLEEVMEINISKLKVRYPKEFEQEKAINRDLRAERKVLEGKRRMILPGVQFTEISEDELDV